MKILFISICLFLVISNCSDGKKNSERYDVRILSDLRVDSVKWFYYAYLYQGKVLFEKDNEKFSFNPVECDISIIEQRVHNDTFTYKLNFSKDGYNYIHTYDGMMIYGFNYFQGVFIPLTGIVKLDHFGDIDFIRADNKKTDSNFVEYLKKANSTKMSHWIADEAKRRLIL